MSSVIAPPPLKNNGVEVISSTPIKENNDSEVLYITNQLEFGLIDKCLNNTYEDKDLKEPLKTSNRVSKGSKFDQP